MCSLSTYASELHADRLEQQVASQTKYELSNTELLDALSSLSISLESLVKSRAEQSNSLKGVKIPSKEYLELHSTILKISNIIHKSVAQGMLSPKPRNEKNDDLPVLKKRVDKLYQSQSYFSYADFAAIAITSVSVLITIVGLFIAGLSFLGYKSIKDTTEGTAKSIAREVTIKTTNETIDAVVKIKLEELIDEGKFTAHLEKVFDTFVLRSKNGSKTVNWDELDEDINWDKFINESINSDQDKDDK